MTNIEKANVAGKVVGTTQSGKSVYKKYNESGYKESGYSAQDHSDAAKIHSDIAKQQDRTTEAGNKAYKTHMSVSSTHKKEAGRMKAWGEKNTGIEKAFKALELDFEEGSNVELRKQFAEHHDRNPQKFFKAIGKYYEPEEDGESEAVLFSNLSKHEKAEEMLKALNEIKSKEENILKAFGDLDLDFEKAEFDTAERKKLAKKGEAEKDGSFPIKNKEDLKHAIEDWGRAGSKASDKAWIKKRAKELGAEDQLPDKWKKENKMEKALNVLNDFEGL